MKIPVVIALMTLVAAIPVAAVTAANAYGSQETAADEVAGHDGDDDATAHAHADHARARGEPPARTTGEIPSLADALAVLERRGSITIGGDHAFTPAQGVRSGRGTATDPYVIEGFYVDVLILNDTSRAYELRNNYIRKLIVDWTGDGAASPAEAAEARSVIHHNRILDLEVNRNVARTGEPTASVFEFNLIDKVTQLRHFDGIFRYNEVGGPREIPLLGGPRVILNIAGMNAASIHHNMIHGGVDMKLHGHHHSDTPTLMSHNHGRPDAQQEEAHDENHSRRYVVFDFHGNDVLDETGFGVRYTDLDHAGDDTTATSEAEPALKAAHVHRTTVSIVNNTVTQAPLRLDVFNAEDKRHKLPGEHGLIILDGNTIIDPKSGDGIVVGAVRNAEVIIDNNTLTMRDPLASGGAGIRVHALANATLQVAHNVIDGYRFGVRATSFDADTTWSVFKNSISGARDDVWWDETVAHAPADERAGHREPHAHEHESARRAPDDGSVTRDAFAHARAGALMMDPLKKVRD